MELNEVCVIVACKTKFSATHNSDALFLKRLTEVCLERIRGEHIICTTSLSSVKYFLMLKRGYKAKDKKTSRWRLTSSKIKLGN